MPKNEKHWKTTQKHSKVSFYFWNGEKKAVTAEKYNIHPLLPPLPPSPVIETFRVDMPDAGSQTDLNPNSLSWPSWKSNKFHFNKLN